MCRRGGLAPRRRRPAGLAQMTRLSLEHGQREVRTTPVRVTHQRRNICSDGHTSALRPTVLMADGKNPARGQARTWVLFRPPLPDSASVR
jgi:hypothetical protein